MSVFLQHFTYFSQVFVNLGRVKISQIRPKLDIHKRIGQYLLSDSCSNKESDTREFGLSHSCGAAQLAVGVGWSVPLRGTYGEMGGLLCPTAALLRSLQWVSDSRSRVAEHRGRWEVCYTPQLRCFAACSGFRTVGPASRNQWGVGDCCIMCEMHYDMYVMHYDMYVMHCVMREMSSVLKGHVYMKPTASCEAAQLWV